MARPPVKRSKLNQPNQRAKRVQQNQAKSSPTATYRQLETKLAHKETGSRPSDSDDSDGLVTKAEHRPNRRGIYRQEIFASGGVAPGLPLGHEVKVPENVHNTRTLRSAPLPKGLRATSHQSSSPLAQPSTTHVSKEQTYDTAAVSPRPGDGASTATSKGISKAGSAKNNRRNITNSKPSDQSQSLGLDQNIDEFLPDDESTPLGGIRKRKLTPILTSGSPEGPRPPSRSSPALEDDISRAISASRLPPILPNTQSRRRRLPSNSNDEIMAMPESSSTEPSPAKAPITKSGSSATKAHAKKPPVLSTSSLQAMMPNRRQTRPRRTLKSTEQTEFDIPEDSSNLEEGDGGDDSYAAAPNPRHTAGRMSTRPVKLQKKNGKPVSTEGASSSTTRSRAGKFKTTRQTSTHPPPASTPPGPTSVPLTSTAKQTSQQTYPQQKDGPTDQAENVEDKENRPSDSSGDSSSWARQRRSTRSGKGVGSGAASSSNAKKPRPGLNSKRAVAEVDPGGKDHTNQSESGFEGDTLDADDSWRREQRHLVTKFQEVDEWEMEFEDVTLGSQGSDSLAR